MTQQQLKRTEELINKTGAELPEQSTHRVAFKGSQRVQDKCMDLHWFFCSLLVSDFVAVTIGSGYLLLNHPLFSLYMLLIHESVE